MSFYIFMWVWLPNHRKEEDSELCEMNLCNCRNDAFKYHHQRWELVPNTWALPCCRPAAASKQLWRFYRLRLEPCVMKNKRSETSISPGLLWARSRSYVDQAQVVLRRSGQPISGPPIFCTPQGAANVQRPPCHRKAIVRSPSFKNRQRQPRLACHSPSRKQRR